MDYKSALQTKNKSAGTNTCQFIILHHTWTPEGTIKGVLNTLTISKGDKAVSCHYVVDSNGDVHKIGNDTDILWHAGLSAWWNLTGMNSYSIGIEIIGGATAEGGFTDIQREAVWKLVVELSKKYGIGKWNILRHKDISPWRKTDVSDPFWSDKFKTFNEYKDSLFSAPSVNVSRYTGIMNSVLAETGFKPLLEKHEGNAPLTEQETKELIEIVFARFAERNGLK